MPISNEDFKDPSALYKWSKILIFLSIGMSVIGVISGFMEYQFLLSIADGTFAYLSDEAFYLKADHNDIRESIIGGIQFLLFILQGIIVLMWIYRANKNVRALGASYMRFSPGWSVGWYFIPIVHLWKPYQAMKEIFINSEELAPKPKKNKRFLLPLWWTLWIISEVIGRIILKYAMNRDLDLDDLLTMSLVYQMGDAFDILLNIVFLLIIISVHQWQMACKNQHSDPLAAIDTLIK